MNKNSIKTFGENPLLGKGSGQWFNNVYKHGVNDVLPLADGKKYVRYRSHNLYFKIIVEYGIVGFLLFFWPFFGSLIKYKNRWTELSGVLKSSWVSLSAYLVVVYFYADAIPYEFFFSGITLLAFINVGVLISHDKKRETNSTIINGVILALAAINFSWFVYSKMQYESYKKIQIENTDSLKSLTLLEESYHPILNTSFTFDYSLTHQIANLYERLNDHEQAEEYYRRALKETPYNEPLLRSYVNFCIDLKKPKKIVKPYIDLLLFIHPKFEENILLKERYNIM